MKRDVELIRSILMRVEESQTLKPIWSKDFAIDGRTEEEIISHVQLLEDAKYLEVVVIKEIGGIPRQFVISRITWAGHEFLSNARNEKTWKKTMTNLGNKAQSVSFEILIKLLAKSVEAAVGLVSENVSS